MQELIARSFDFEANEDGVITGVPIVFDSRTNIGGMFTETISRNAITENVLKDVAFFYNHDLNTKPLARTRNGRLNFEIKEDGVHMTANVNRERSDANDLYLAIRDGDIDGMSFMFRIEEDEWEGLDTTLPHRNITKIGYVQEVSAVNYPAYSDTTINARSLDLDKSALDRAKNTLDSEKRKQEERSQELELIKAKYEFL